MYTGRQTGKLTQVRKDGEYSSTIRKKEILPFVTAWMKLEGIMLSEISQKRQIPYDLTCMWNLKQNKTKENKLKLIVTGKQTGGCQRQGGGWAEWGKAVKWHRLRCTNTSWGCRAR